MAMQIEKNFVVQSPADEVWAFLIDPYRVARCLPGAAITGQVDENTYSGTVAIKVGPVSSKYKGKVVFERIDADAREAELSGSGQDVRGRGGAKMKMTSRVVERAPGEAEVFVTSEVTVVGLLAQMGRGMIQDVSDQLFERFTSAMKEELQAAGEAKSSKAVAEASAAATAATDASGVAVGEAARSEIEAPSSADELKTASAPSSTLPSRSTPAASAQPASEPIQVLTFGPKIIFRALGRALRRPGFWIGLVIVAALVVGLWLALRK